MKKDTDMKFLDHLEVFRWHLIRSGVAIIICSILAFVFKDIVFNQIILAPRNIDFPTYIILCKISNLIGLGNTLCLEEPPFTLINIHMSGQFSTHILVSIVSGIIISFPYVFWQIWSFVKPALYTNEIKLARGIVFFSSLLFFIGIIFGYYVISPMSINFLGTYQVSSIVTNNISLVSFISTVTTICLANGIIFQLPIVVYFLTKVGFLTPHFMRLYRKHALIITLILSAVITPPDVTSQILVSLPLLILYELSIKISSRVLKNKRVD